MENRRIHILVFIFVIAIIYLLRLGYLQLIDTKTKLSALNNSINRVVSDPGRGLIYDRKGKLIVSNRPSIDFQFIRKNLRITDTALFCQFFHISPDVLREKIAEAQKKQFWDKPFTFVKDVSDSTYSTMVDRIDEFEGISVEVKTDRRYEYPTLAHALGYVREVDQFYLDNQIGNYYRKGDYIGKSGIEFTYEKYLRGRRGVSYVLTNVSGATKGSYLGGRFDTLPIVGAPLKSSIDLSLQLYAERLMQNKKGAVVAIEPSTGEILVMASFPNYDPKLLSGDAKTVAQNYLMLKEKAYNPLFNRAIQSPYPPGSTLKTAMALIGLQDGVLDTISTVFSCNQAIVKCHPHPSPQKVFGSIQYSCNPFYYQAFRRIIMQNKSKDDREDARLGLENWRSYALELGLGTKLGVDIPFEVQGRAPSTEYYDKIHRGAQNWKFGNLMSLAIGQGEVGVSPLQLANLAACISNRGWYIKPHLIKAIGEEEKTLPQYTEKQVSRISPAYFDFVARAMEMAVKAGTASKAYIEDIKVCGKTGTAQNPHGKDHSVFMCFAPLNKPQIAIAVLVENSGFGGSWAAPVAGLIAEMHIRGSISPKRKWIEDYVLKADLMDPGEAEKNTKKNTTSAYRALIGR
jgi:penicillin-binding protein 2